MRRKRRKQRKRKERGSCLACGEPVPADSRYASYCSPAHYMKGNRRDAAGLHWRMFPEGRRGRLRLGEKTKAEREREEIAREERENARLVGDALMALGISSREARRAGALLTCSMCGSSKFELYRGTDEAAA